jgi:hypothetical protein
LSPPNVRSFCVLVDGTVGGTTEGGDIGAIVEQLAAAADNNGGTDEHVKVAGIR